MRLVCERSPEVAKALCARVEEFTKDLPLASRVMEIMSWEERGVQHIVSLIARVIPHSRRYLFAIVRAAASKGPARAHLFLEDLVLLGEGAYGRLNHQVGGIMRLSPGDRRRAVYSFPRGDAPFF